VKLLSPAYIKDAARSVKRICKEIFIEAHDSVLTELLGIAALKVNMYCLRQEGMEEVIHLRCSHRNDAAVCSRCGTASEAIHEEKERCVRHPDIRGKRTFPHFYSRRFMCEQCRQPFTESLPFIEKFRRHTVAFEGHIYEQCKAGCRKKSRSKRKIESGDRERDPEPIRPPHTGTRQRPSHTGTRD
jgi:hypothetical protein